jgi:hypothetical protein
MTKKESVFTDVPILHRTFALGETKVVDAEAGIFEAWITTEAIDRDGDIVVAAGAEFENFLKNPVVLFGHNYWSPENVVGKAIALEPKKGKGIRARWQFAGEDVSPKADIVRRLWEGGFLNATSIGFIVKESVWIDADGEELEDDPQAYAPTGAAGRKFKRWELLEFSIVPVPANQEAVRMSLSAKIVENLDSNNDLSRTYEELLELLEKPIKQEEKIGSITIVNNLEVTERELDSLDSDPPEPPDNDAIDEGTEAALEEAIDHLSEAVDEFAEGFGRSNDNESE